MKLEVCIRKKLRDFVLEVDFVVCDEVFALLGASGCGKSMTLKCIAGIETPDEGKIILNGRVLYDSAKKINLPPQARRVGYLFQNYALFPNMTVAENILFVSVGSKAERHSKVEENLERYQIKEKAGVKPMELSGGQQQRVAIARVMASQAEIILLDEPLSALDSYLKWEIELELKKILKRNRGSIIVSHDVGEVYRLSEKIGVMSAGVLELVASKREVFEQAGTRTAMIVTGCKNVSEARVVGDKIYAEEWCLELRVASAVADVKYVGIRSRDIVLGVANGENTYLMEVVEVIEDVERYVVMVRYGGGGLICWEVEKEKWDGKRRRLYLEFPAKKVKVAGEWLR